MPGSNGSRTVRIGAGAGYAGDRWEPALDLVERAELDVLVFECLAERTIALGHLERLNDPSRGYNPFLAERFEAVLGPALARGVKIVTNMGAANPRGAAEAVRDIGRRLGLPPFTVAVVAGDDVTGLVRASPDLPLMETGEPVSSLFDRMVAANAYLGGGALRDALAAGADVVITGRVADPSLFVGPLMHAHGWAEDDLSRLGPATVVGHLLECAGQLTGGYFADPGVKDVPGLDRLGFPFAEVGEDGAIVLGKLDEAGGMITPATCAEQLLYEVDDPAAYLTPDCVADFSGVRFAMVAKDRVEVTGATARAAPPTLKVSVSYRAGYIGEGQVAYAGPNAAARARLAGEVVRSRLAQRRLELDELRVDHIGLDAVHGAATPAAGNAPEPYEVRLRVAARTQHRRTAEYVGQEVQSLLTNGPYGGAGDFTQVRELVGVRSVLVPREAVRPSVELLR
jgi:hypothetical protein